jgi:hypothetical protein
MFDNLTPCKERKANSRQGKERIDMERLSIGNKYKAGHEKERQGKPSQGKTR